MYELSDRADLQSCTVHKLFINKSSWLRCKGNVNHQRGLLLIIKKWTMLQCGA